MGYSISLVIIAFQLTSALATISIPFKCMLQDSLFNGILNKTEPNFKVNEESTQHPLKFDVLHIDQIAFEQDGLFLEVKSLEIRGIQDAILDALEYNLESNVIRLTMHSDLFATSRYKAAGSLFLLPIEGDGDVIFNAKNIQLYVVTPFDIKDVNGTKYLELKSYSYWYDVRDNADFKLTNLYNGNKELSDSMHRIINQNWKLLTIQYGRHFFNNVVNNLFEDFRKYMLDLPLRDFSKC